MSLIPMQSTEFGKAVAIYPRYTVLEDSTKSVKLDGGAIYAGRAVSLNATSELIPTTTNVAVYGLAKANFNTYRNEVTDTSFGIYGSGLMTVLVEGIVDVQHSTFPSSTGDGSYTTVKTYDDTLTFTPGEKLYVTISGAKAGQLTNVKVATATDDRNDNTLVGTVLVAPATAGASMQILLGR